MGIERYNEQELPEFNALKGRELGFVLSKKYWGRGLMPEAVLAVIQYLFEDVKLDFIICEHFLDNIQSCRVQEKCGFVHFKLGKCQTHYVATKDTWISVLYNINKNSY